MRLKEAHEAMAREVARYIRAGDEAGYHAAAERQKPERARMTAATLFRFRERVHELVEAP